MNDPCRGWCLFFDGELGLHPDVNADGGDYLVIPPLNLNPNTVSITAWIKPDPWLTDPQKGTYEQKATFTGIVHTRGANTIAGITYGADLGFTYDGSLTYEWGEIWCWSWPCFVYISSIPDWQWSMVALVVEPEQTPCILLTSITLSTPTMMSSVWPSVHLRIQKSSMAGHLSPAMKLATIDSSEVVWMISTFTIIPCRQLRLRVCLKWMERYMYH
ncbi:MAG: hypothetical protein JSV82_09170 [Planctomycetota bacterium]|nr:MAG: hypothetical protein JSV82_09170 [Planctomycetota bacterium]